MTALFGEKKPSSNSKRFKAPDELCLLVCPNEEYFIVSCMARCDDLVVPVASPSISEEQVSQLELKLEGIAVVRREPNLPYFKVLVPESQLSKTLNYINGIFHDDINQTHVRLKSRM